MTRRTRLGAIVLTWIVALATLHAGDLRVTPLVADGQVYASFAAGEQFSADVRESVQSGLSTTLTFFVDLRQSSVIWFDRNVSSVTVAAAIKYDTLAKRFTVSKMTDGQVSWAQSTDREDEAARWAMQFDRVRLSSGGSLEANGEYYVRVRMRAAPRRSVSLWPWGRDDAAGRADFTYIR